MDFDLFLNENDDCWNENEYGMENGKSDFAKPFNVPNNSPTYNNNSPDQTNLKSDFENLKTLYSQTQTHLKNKDSIIFKLQLENDLLKKELQEFQKRLHIISKKMGIQFKNKKVITVSKYGIKEIVF